MLAGCIWDITWCRRVHILVLPRFLFRNIPPPSGMRRGTKALGPQIFAAAAGNYWGVSRCCWAISHGVRETYQRCQDQCGCCRDHCGSIGRSSGIRPCDSRLHWTSPQVWDGLREEVKVQTDVASLGNHVILGTPVDLWCLLRKGLVARRPHFGPLRLPDTGAVSRVLKEEEVTDDWLTGDPQNTKTPKGTNTPKGKRKVSIGSSASSTQVEARKVARRNYLQRLMAKGGDAKDLMFNIASTASTLELVDVALDTCYAQVGLGFFLGPPWGDGGRVL